MDRNLNRYKVLEMLKNREISSAEAFQLIKKMPNTLNIASTQSQEAPWDIAIIGMSCQFPDARNVHEFWHNLASGINSVREIPRERWDVDEIDIPEVQKSGKWGGFLAEIDRFDPLFFNISPLEAEVMDPQQRLFLQEAWRALEDAGYSDRELSGKKCGVFVGCTVGDYGIRLREGGIKPTAYAFMGNAASILPARISYHLNLQGPAIAVDTACSSSLIALHLACTSIRTGTCEIAVVGGVQLITTSQIHTLASIAGMLSATGQCKAFDDSADGFVPGEGVGVVILKSLEAARKDGDHIYAVIKGSDINQDGKSNGITAPNATSQTALECEVYKKFNIHPETISYVETHGTGTILGDPI
jgi:acyl transferase domain-containing protein